MATIPRPTLFADIQLLPKPGPWLLENGLDMSELTAGIYRHYKGQRYRVYEVARHSETEEAFVVYRCLYGDFSLWVRPLAMFTEAVRMPDGSLRPRFEYLGPAEE